MPISFVFLALGLCVIAALFVLVPARAASRADQSAWLASVGVFAAVIVVGGTTVFYSLTSEWNWTPDGIPDSPLAQQLYELQRAVHDNASDSAAWATLGRFYLQFETQLPAAIDALDRSVSLAGGRDIETNLNLVEALAIRGAPNDQQRSADILNASLKLDPTHRKALWYGSEVAASLGQWDVAIARWQVMLSDAKTLNTEEAQSVVMLLEQRIQAAQREKESSGGSQAAIDHSANPHAGKIGGSDAPEAVRVRVTLDRALAQTEGLTPSTNVFIFVRPKEQGGPPLAVHRATMGQLPLNVVLSDADAMMPSRTLSSFDQLEIVARISLGGTPTMTPGDLFGLVSLSPGDPRDISILIDQVSKAP